MNCGHKKRTLSGLPSAFEFSHKQNSRLPAGNSTGEIASVRPRRFKTTHRLRARKRQDPTLSAVLGALIHRLAERTKPDNQ